MEPAHEEKQTIRLEAFSDGVIAIAITLLILEIKVPEEVSSDSELSHALREQWPSYLAFVTSFANIGIMWINHHRIFKLITRSDHMLLVLNALLLLGITFITFPTALVAEYIQHPGERVAMMVYSGTFFVIALIFNLLWRYAIHNRRLLDPQADQKKVQQITNQYRFGPLIYFAALVLAWFEPTGSLILTLLLAVFFALPDDWGKSKVGTSP